ncbi:hypothetical protein TWF481_010979 [Arthrobotrys musiformis]|uniref:Amidohydrolase 3 domain-containing protein n=1 Tax=Arthrobotrys musiformis TaxID=47236 RepID=A0AAV9VYX2_9PEZI
MFRIRDYILPIAFAAGAYAAFRVGSSYDSYLAGSSTSPNGHRLYCAKPGQVYTGLEDETSESPDMASCFEVLANGTFGRTWRSKDDLSALQKVYVRDIDGWAFPGFWDGHGHITQYGQMELSVKAYGQTLDGVMKALVTFLDERFEQGYGTREKWVLGGGWDQENFGGKMPTAEDIVRHYTLRGKYIALYRVDVHCIWVSPAVMKLLPDPLPPAPPGGSIPSNGVFCDNAMDEMIIPLLPPVTDEDMHGLIKTAIDSLRSFGIVGVVDAATAMKEVPVYKSFVESGKMEFRVYGMVECEKRNTFCKVDKYHFADLTGQFTLTSAKIFADGALGSWGAALLEPYSDKPTRGTMLINETELTDIVSQWYVTGWQVGVHGIGDAANRAALNAFETAMARSPGIDNRKKFKLEHAQIIHPDDQHRRVEICVAAGVELEGCIVPSIQPTHATSDMEYAIDRLGLERVRDSAYRMKSLFPGPQVGVQHPPFPVLGSDFPVEPPSPLEGMYAAYTRCNPRSDVCERDEVWDNERISRLQAVQGFGRNVGWGGMLQGWEGVGQLKGWADWVILTGNLFDEAVDVRKVEVLETWIGGKRVYRKIPPKRLPMPGGVKVQE